MSLCVIEVSGVETDPKDILNDTNIELLPVHFNHYQIYVENNSLTFALKEVAAIIDDHYEQFKMILHSCEDAEIWVEVRNYDLMEEVVIVPVSIIKLIDRLGIQLKFECHYK